MFAPAAMAQDSWNVAPKQPTANAAAGVSDRAGATGQSAPEADAGKVILPRLLGLRFVPHASDVIVNGVHRSGLDIAAVPGLDDPDITEQLRSYLGGPFTFGDLRDVEALVKSALSGKHHGLVNVTVPDQDVTTGTVQLVVTQYVVGRVKVGGNRHFSNTVIAKGIDLPPGAPLDFGRLKRDLDWLNRNPFRQVNAVLEPGAAPDGIDIDVAVKERFPFRAYASFDNSGAPSSGRDRWSFGLNFGNLFGRDQQLSAQVTAGDDVLRHPTDGRFLATSLSYTVPLVWHDLIQITGAYVRQSPDVGPYFGQVGRSWQASLRYIDTLGGLEWLSQEVWFGFDFKSTNNDLSFGGVQVFAASQEVDQFSLTYNGSETDDWGITALENDVFYSPGNLTGSNTDRAFSLSGTTGAKADYTYDTLSLTRLMRLTFGASWVTRARWQWASGDLLPSEQLAGGGEGSVRGYDPHVIEGSEGVLVTEELRLPPMHLLSHVSRLDDGLQLYGFWDFARLGDPTSKKGDPAHAYLASAGAGLDYSIGRNLSIEADYGWQLRRLAGAARRGARADLAVTVSY